MHAVHDSYTGVLPRTIAFLGGESTGKSTLAQALVKHLGAEYVPEFAREYWVTKGGVFDSNDMCFIALRQARLERLAVARAKGYVICDTTPLTTLFYHRWTLHDAENQPLPVPPRMVRLAQNAYGLTVLCGDEIAHEQDGTRDSAAFRTRQQADYTAHVHQLTTPWIAVQGSVSNRVAQVLAALKTLP
jgi:HTH-type transcriptional regulator, transcriptional repressor of NAD biosynthesis genes